MRLRRNGEDGAVLVIVVLLTIGLFGMVTLTVDLGALLSKRRQLVTAADSGALAAAQSCALAEGQATADVMAGQYAQANAGTGITVDPPQYSPGCWASAGRVTVVVHDDQETFFAPVLGFGDTMPVEARAVAVWGGVGGGSFVPFMLSWGRLADCGFDPTTQGPGSVPPDGTQCTFWLDNKLEDMGNSQWAMLNLNTITSNPDRWGWNVPRDYGSCQPANTAETIDWIVNGSPFLDLNYPSPTFVCIDSGASPVAFRELAKLAGQSRLFPVNDPNGLSNSELPTRYNITSWEGGPHGQVNKAGEPCPSPCQPGNGEPGYNGPIDKYDIIGFAWLRIDQVLEGGPTNANNPTRNIGDETCNQPQDSNGWCLVVAWNGYYTNTDELPEEARPFNVLQWWLIE